MDVERHGSGGPYEARVGYSRVVRAGDLVVVSGCTAITSDGAVQGGDSAYDQAVAALTAIERALATVGARVDDVVQTRMYVTDIARWEEVGRAHGEVFADVRPAATMVEVSALIDPRLLVEVEAMAHLPRDARHEAPNRPV